MVSINNVPTMLCIVNVYMPSDIKEGDYEYRDMMDQLNEVIQKYEETYDILLCGNMNVHSMSQVFSMFSRYFEFPFALCIFIEPMIAVCIFCFAMQGNVNQTPNNTNSTTSNNKTSVEEVAQLDGKNHTVCIVCHKCSVCFRDILTSLLHSVYLLIL
jgi:hypothetical protein